MIDLDLIFKVMWQFIDTLISMILQTWFVPGLPNPLYRTLKQRSENVNDLDLIFKVTWLFIGNHCIHDSSTMECARITKPGVWDALVEF